MKGHGLFLLGVALLAAQPTQQVEITREPHHKLVLANDRVRVFDVNVPPRSETVLHWHHHDYVNVALGNSEFVNAVQGKQAASVKLSDGDVVFVQGDFEHVLRNTSAEPFRNITIELLRPLKQGVVSPHWDPKNPEEDRGLEVLHGGTREILFVKDGVRVSEIDLQPGGMIPFHHHAGPHLAVALTNYELNSDRGKGAKAIKITMRRGESQWFGGDLSHVITNTGQEEAKIITLEFK